MTKHLINILFLLAALSICQVGYAQKKQSAKTISGGQLNGKATSLPEPVYPQDARAADIAGMVRVQVMIDETGKVVSAKAISGPASASLRSAAESAALRAEFTPTLLSEQPVKVSGTIDYNFAAAGREERIKYLIVGGMVNMVGRFASDLDKLKTAMDGEDMLVLIAMMADEMPAISSELGSISKLDKVPAGKRSQAIEDALASMRSKLKPADQWQLDMGSSVGKVVGQLLYETSQGEFDAATFDWVAIKSPLERIRELTASAPADFPPDVLERIKDVNAVTGRGNLEKPENLLEFAGKIMELFEVMSPGSTK